MIKIYINIVPSYDVEKIKLFHYNEKTRKIILSNLKNYTKLKEFNCSYNKLTELSDLPNSLTHLYCYDNNLTELPDLPNSLINLDCHNNNLTELPDLPNSLKELYCGNNNLTKLPDLPNSLKELWCSSNNLTKLPDLPNSLITLKCNNNKLTYPNLEFKTINEINSKNRIIKKMKILNKNILLEHSARITMNPKRIKRLLDNLEIDFYDGSFDTLTS